MTHHHHTAGIPPSNPPFNPHEAEARERWGHTDAYKQSQERVKNMGREDWERVQQEADDINRALAAAAESGHAPADSAVQELIARHFAWLGHFYEPTTEMYRGLGDLYANDPRFAAHYDAYRPGLAAFLRDAMHAFCDTREQR